MRRYWLLLLGVPLLVMALPAQGRTLTAPAIRLVAASPGLTLNPSAGKPGETITVSGTGFACHGGKAIAVIFFNAIQQGSGAPVACTGTFTASFRLPDVAIGTYTVSAEGYAPKASPPPPATPTDTPIPTDTPTATATSTGTATMTATATATPTATPVPTGTATNTPTPTATPTLTPTQTATPTPTATGTVSQPPPGGFAPQAHLTVSKTADAASVRPGTPIGFTITAGNSSAPPAGIATGATLSDPLPAGPGLSWSISPSYAGPGMCSITGTVGSQTLTCSFGTLLPGASTSVHVSSGTTDSSCGTFTNTATFSASNAQAVTASASTAVQCASLTLNKTADKARVVFGNDIGFTITAGNAATAAAPADGATLSDPLPAPAGSGVTWFINPPYPGPGTCSISGASGSQVLTCSYGTLAPGATASVHVGASTDVDCTTTFCCAGGPYNNTATVTATNAAPVTASATITVFCVGLRVRSDIAAGASLSASVPPGYSPDGDRASASMTVTAPSAPFTVKQTLDCTTPPTVGVKATCTIVETVSNPSGHPLAFSTVSNRLAPNVASGPPAAGKGTIGVSGHHVTWSGFRLAPGQTVRATIPVTFTPTPAQAGHHLVVSTGISANAVDLVSGTRYSTTYGMLQTSARVLAAGQGPSYLPSTGYGGTARQTGSPAHLGSLPSTGGGADGGRRAGRGSG